MALQTLVKLCLVVKLLIASIACAESGSRLDNEQLKRIGNKIFINETGGNPQYLIAWNKGENFASLGIGHFIWFPAGLKSPFTETFPDLIAFLQLNGAKIPPWLLNTSDNPWSNLEEFNAARNTDKMQTLRRLMQNTFELQVRFIEDRMQNSLPKILSGIANSTERQTVAARFQRLAASELGLYTLIDYVNFKGEGIASTEQYNGQGWGLKQVLLKIDEQQSIHNGFAEACMKVLEARVNNSPQKDVESRWLAGWKKRCRTYAE